MRLAKQNGGPWQNREHCFRAADGDARGEALFWGSNGPAMEPGEGQMGNVGSYLLGFGFFATADGEKL